MAISFEVWSTETIDVLEHPLTLAPSPSTIKFDPLPTVASAIKEVTTEKGRWYTLDGIAYPSITTMIRATDIEGQTALSEWRSRVGHEAAQDISKKAAAHGNNWHKFAELFVSGKPYWSCMTTSTDIRYASVLGNLLNNKILRVIASESPVVSLIYGLAGRVDLCVQLRDGRYAIIDFKTGKKVKNGNRLENYFIQGSFYGNALTELWESNNIKVDTVIIVQLTPSTILWQESSVTTWENQLAKKIEQYADILNAENEQ